MSSSTSEWTRDSWRLSGSLTAREVPGLYAASLAQRETDGLPSEVHLGAVEGTDSSALALLLEWLSWARQAGREMAFAEPPGNLRVIAELSDVHELLGWPERERGDDEA
jgi:ABC-type transporter Mla MlaB component